MPFVPINQPEPPSRVFTLATPHHLFMKLHWEVRNLKEQIALQDSIGSQMAAAFFAFNAAVTAWHLTDWVWTSASDDLKSEIATQLKIDIVNEKSNHKKLKLFQDALFENGSLRVCCDIANGSKHMEEHPKATTKTSVDWQIKETSTPDGISVAYTSFELRVFDGNLDRSVIDVFEDVKEFWQSFLSTWGFIEDRFIGLPEADSDEF